MNRGTILIPTQNTLPGTTLIPTWYIYPFRTALSLWGQTTQISSSLPPKRDCGPKRVNSSGTHHHTAVIPFYVAALYLTVASRVINTVGECTQHFATPRPAGIILQ